MAIKYPTVTMREPGFSPAVVWNSMTTPTHSDLGGVFNRDSLPAVLERIEREGRSGKLHLRSGAFRAFVAFSDGQVALARFGTQVDADALERIVALEAGVYEFEPGEVKSSAMIAQDPEALSTVLQREKQSVDAGVILASSVPVKLEADSATSGAINLMRIHWQLMTHIDGQRDFEAIAALIGLNRSVLERPLRDLVAAGLIELRNTVYAAPEPAVPTMPSARVPTVEEQVAQIKQSGFGQTGFGSSPPTPGRHTQADARHTHSEAHVTRESQTSRGTSSRAIALERLSAIRDSVVGRSSVHTGPATLNERPSRSTVNERPGSATHNERSTQSERAAVTAPPPLQAMQVLGPVNPAFFRELQPRLASLIGPMAVFVLEDAAAFVGGSLDALRAEHLDDFLRYVVAEVPPAKHAQLSELVRPLLKRYGLRQSKEQG